MATAEQVLDLFEIHNSFPVLKAGYEPQMYIPYNIIAPHEAQAIRNHGQTLQRLAERGGLSWTEILAVLKNKTWKEMGWSDLISSEDVKAREEDAQKEVAAYVKERRAPCGCV